MNKVMAYVIGIFLLVGINNFVNDYIHDHYLNEIFEKVYPIPSKTIESVHPKLVLIGSSTTKTGYSTPMISDTLGILESEILNLATMPNNPEISFKLLEDIAEKIKGSTIVYSIDPWIYSEYYYQHFNYKLSQWDINDRISYLRYKAIGFKTTMNAVNGGNLFITVMSIMRPHRESGQEHGDKDWGGSDSNAKSKFPDWVRYPEFPLSESFFAAIKNIDDLCYRIGCRFVVVYPIYSQTFIDGYSHSSYKPIFESKLHAEVKYADLDTSLLSLSDSHFWDGIHVKPYGKIAQTMRLINIVRNN